MTRLKLFTAAGAAALCMAAVAAPAPAEPALSLDLTLSGVSRAITLRYSCADDSTLSLRYVTAGDTDLALMTRDGKDRLFVAVIAASGVRYVSGQWEWWTKGPEATLTDLMARDKAVHCTQADPAAGN